MCTCAHYAQRGGARLSRGVRLQGTTLCGASSTRRRRNWSQSTRPPCARNRSPCQRCHRTRAGTRMRPQTRARPHCAAALPARVRYAPPDPCSAHTLNADSSWRAREVHVNHNAASACVSEFAESGLQKKTRDGQQAHWQAEQLAMARQKQRREEMDMLHFSLSGARIFFRD